MELTTNLRKLNILVSLLPLAETVARVATPAQKHRMLRWVARLDQQMAQLRDDIDREIDCRR
jgi:hypothetical protein